MNLYHHFRLKVNENPYRSICHSMGGIHKVIQILEMLTPATDFFAINANRDDVLKPHHVRQYRFKRGGVQALSPYSRVWHWNYYDQSEVYGLGVYQVESFLEGLEHAINHGVFVPENIYFQTIDRINLLREQKTGL